MTSSSSDQLPPDRVPPELGRALMGQLAVPVFALGRDGRVLLWNQACERLTGVPASQVLGTASHWGAFYQEPRPCLADLLLYDQLEELPEMYDVVPALPLLDPQEPVSVEIWCPMPHIGEQKYLLADASRVVSASGELLAVVECVRDLTRQIRTRDELEHMVMRDPLTGQVNRPYFDALLHKEWLRLRRAEGELSLLMVDIDHFQRYNECYGAAAGDICLQRVGTVLQRELLRASDVVSRYRGGGFAIGLPDTGLAGALQVAQRIQAAVQGLAMPHAQVASGRLTVSIGVAAVRPGSGLTPAQLLVQADDALYRAKCLGRNRVESQYGGETRRHWVARPAPPSDERPDTD